MRHYEKYEIELRLSGRKGIFARWLCRRHLKHCNQCRERLEELRSDERFLQDVRRLKALRKLTPETLSKLSTPLPLPSSKPENDDATAR